MAFISYMKRSAPSFSNARRLADRIDSYFTCIEGEYSLEKKAKVDRTRQKAYIREPEPPTIAGLALFLGFDSIRAFNEYEEKGRFANTLKRGRLRIESVYEKKLHHHSSAGAIFALKNMGWDNKKDEENSEKVGSLKIEVVEAGPKLAQTEQEVIL